MIYVGRKCYPYMEEINEGILRQLRRLTMAGGRMLDVGCGRAALGEAVQQLGWEVWGIEENREACATARTRIPHLIEGNLLDTEYVRQSLGETQFDALVFSDVLEHLYDPRSVLESYLRYLKPGGRVLISVPNAVVWTNRIQWLLGRINYQDTGVMDRTHIRFFTFRTTRQLVEAAGCRMDRVDFTPYLVRAVLPLIKRVIRADRLSGDYNPRAMIDSPGYRLYMRYVYPVEYAITFLWKRMLSFRIIVVGVKP